MTTCTYLLGIRWTGSSEPSYAPPIAIGLAVAALATLAIRRLVTRRARIV